MIRAFTECTKGLKIRGINPPFHLIDNETSAALKVTMTTMNIKYQLTPPSNRIEKNAERKLKPSKATS